MMGTFKAVKNKKQTTGAMKAVILYMLDGAKTSHNGRFLNSGFNCNVHSAFTEMTMTKQQHRKTSDRQFYQFVQSFPKNTTLSAEQVHQLGLEFVANQFPNFEVLVSTHCNTNNLHNHILVNSVSFETGKKLHQNHDDLVQHRQMNDELCIKFGDTPLEKYQKGQKNNGMSSREYRSAIKGESWKIKLINAIDDCMKFATTKAMFTELMESEGYKVQWSDSRKYITFITEKGQKCRDHRLHEDKYLKENMENEFRIREKIILRGAQTAEQISSVANTSTNDFGTNNITATGIDAQRIAVPEQSSVQGFADRTTDFGRTERDAEPLCHEQSEGEIGRYNSGITELEQDNFTGWEAERASIFANEIQTHENRIGRGNAVPFVGSGSLGNSLLRLGSSVESAINGNKLQIPLAKIHMDRKVYRKIREKKIALGHKENDIGEYDFEIKMRGF